MVGRKKKPFLLPTPTRTCVVSIFLTGSAFAACDSAKPPAMIVAQAKPRFRKVFIFISSLFYARFLVFVTRAYSELVSALRGGLRLPNVDAGRSEVLLKQSGVQLRRRDIVLRGKRRSSTCH